MNLWSTLGIGPAAGVGAALAGLVCAGAFALWRLRRKARAKSFDLGLDSAR
ncbi:MAG TPA: hypothetical protein VMV21_00870 [Vicinamibacteria bacterium]|nr:hypothetical protein [Vicinamibacteria bacterium]